MKLNEVSKMKNSYLYEGLNRTDSKSMLLWEGAGQAIAEAQLTQDQITQLFQQIEKGATAGGDNRTLAGKGKDVASAVNQAYQNLKGKVENSATMQMFDQKYEEAAAKLKQATGGDAGAMKYVEKYRAFAKKHPIAQSLVYSALIAAAGISGAGAGGAAALGLLKMTDKLLQGEKFSKAAVAGAETGAMAYAAGQVGKAMKGDTTTTSSSYSRHTTGLQPANPWDIPGGVKKEFPLDKFTYKTDGIDLNIYNQAGKLVATRPGIDAMESIQLTNDQVSSLFESIIIREGLWDKFKTKVLGEPEERASFAQDIKQGVKQAAGAVGAQAQRIGHNITTKITADKLQKAWKAAGSPADSKKITAFLQQQGIETDVINDALKSLNLPADKPKTTSGQATQQDQEQPNQSQQAASDASKFDWVNSLDDTQRQQLLAQVNSMLSSSTTQQQTPTNQTSQDSIKDALRKRQAAGGVYENKLSKQLKQAIGR